LSSFNPKRGTQNGEPRQNTIEERFNDGTPAIDDGIRCMNRILDLLETVIDHIQMILLCAIVGSIGAQIFSRKFFNLPLEFPEELSLFIFIAVVLLGISIVEKENTHIKVEFLYERLSEAGKKIVYVSGKLLTAALVTAILNGERQLLPRIYHLKTTAAGIPYLWIHIIIVLSCLFWLFAIVCTLVRVFKRGES
jgi:TRAP-type C4-dicarboxylate transport system permease small subunit